MVLRSDGSRSRTVTRRTVGRSFGLIALALPLLLTACVTNSGGPPPTLSASCERFYQSYLRERSPRFFVTDVSGRNCSYTYCPVEDVDCVAAYPGPILRSCEQRGGRECYIYARGRSINWQGPPTGK